MKKIKPVIAALLLSSVTLLAHPGHGNAAHVHLAEAVSVNPIHITVMLTAFLAVSLLFRKKITAFK